MYADGHGVSQDYREAVKWYRKAAEQGDAKAQHNLGANYYNGLGVQQDIVIAYAWLNVSVVQGFETAVKNRDLAAKKMTPSQLEKGQELSREYFKKYTK